MQSWALPLIALENAKNGINVNAICPGIVETDLIKGVEQRMEAQGMPPDEFRERLLVQIPMADLQPEEIAHIALFLASSESDGMNGEAIAIYAPSSIKHQGRHWG